MSLWSMFLENESGKEIGKWTHYFPAYERHFARFVNTPMLIIEIGVYKGGSLQLWKKYFGPYARVVGIDIDERTKEFEEEQISVRIGDQTDTKFLRRIVDEFGAPDIVLDDGSHRTPDVETTFNFLYPLMSSNGVYFVEDLHTAYWREYGVSFRRKSFIERAKALIDELNGHWVRRGSRLTSFTDSTLSMHFYDGLVVFERGKMPPRSSIRTGGLMDHA